MPFLKKARGSWNFQGPLTCIDFPPSNNYRWKLKFQRSFVFVFFIYSREQKVNDCTKKQVKTSTGYGKKVLAKVPK